MEAELKPAVERRRIAPEQSMSWGKLSLAQKFSASSLGKFGYELAFIRRDGSATSAILLCSGGVAVISDDGEIDTSPNIKIR